MRGNCWLGVFGGALAALVMGEVATAAACPTAIEPLAAQLLEDLPAYANRSIRRSVGDRTELSRHIILAGRAEYEPLPLGSQEYQQSFPDARQQVAQVFFTTLEQRSRQRERSSTQNYHWLILAQTPERGWDLLAMFTRPGALAPNVPPQTVRETTRSAIAQGIRLWLRDCDVGALR
ncbi:MAG: hypothetical protein AAFY11_08070 [Cyanobacteria bacterium J06641_5]